ncbi:MAG: glycosyltransferase [Cyclobacteriaceae bacterium]
MNILFLTPYPNGSAPSQRFRFELFFGELASEGWNYQVESFWDEKSWRRLYEGGSTWKKIVGLVKGFARRKWLMLHLRTYDVIFIHREVAPIGPPIFEWFMAKVLKKKIIYDFDDAIWLPNTSDQNSIVGRLKWHNKVSAICRWSWKVSVGNVYLANFARKHSSEVSVLPTVVDTDIHLPCTKNLEKKAIYQRPITNNHLLTIGWTGSHSTLKYLKPLIPVLQTLAEQFDFTFAVIADRDPKLPLKNYRFIRWSKETEVADLNQLDIGLMPLADDQWSRGKCGFKAIQYGAIGIPALVSPVGVNAEIVEDGETGYHCHTDQDWENSILKLLKDEPLRIRLGKAGRERITQYYSVAAMKYRFLTLFQ